MSAQGRIFVWLVMLRSCIKRDIITNSDYTWGFSELTHEQTAQYVLPIPSPHPVYPVPLLLRNSKHA